jgi:hypothetical protein
MIKAADKAGLDRMPCSCHILHNAVKTALKKQAPLENVVTKLHDLSLLFHRSPKLAQALEREQTRLNMSPVKQVILDVETRWNSIPEMMGRVVELKRAIAAVRTVLRQIPEEQDAYVSINNVYPSDDEWSTADLIIEALGIFTETSLIFSSSTSGIAASLIPWMTTLFIDMDDNRTGNETADTLRRNLKQELEQRVHASKVHVKASIFHPTFNLILKRHNEDQFNEVKELLRRELQDIEAPVDNVIQPAGEKPVSPHRLAKAMQRLIDMQNPQANAGNVAEVDELDRYLQAPQCADAFVNPMSWWKQNEMNFPALSQLARKYLSIPAASVASERMFSTAGNFVTKKRNRLDDEAVSDLVFSNIARRCLQNAEDKAPGKKKSGE